MNSLNKILDVVKLKQTFILKGLVLITHYWFCYYHWSFSLGKLSDSHNFFNVASNASNWLSTFGLGTHFISFLIYPLVKIGFNYQGLFFLFATISLLGYFNYINLFFKYKHQFNKFTLVIIAWFLFLPSLHFWTVFIGKEALLFFLMSCLIKHILEKRPINKFTLPILLLILLVRPYLFVILLMLLIGFYILSIKNKKERFKKIIISTIIAIISIPVLLKFLKIKNLNSINKNYQYIIDFANSKGDSSINLGESNYFERFILVIFKPLPFNVKTFHQFVVSVENVINVLLIILALYLLCIVKKKSKSIHFLLAVSISVILFLAIYMYNLGLASRMRVMFIPYLIYMLFELHLNYFNKEDKR